MHLAQERAAVLAADAANARTPGFAVRDLAPVIEESPTGLRFASAMREAGAGARGAIEYAMGASAENSIRFRALADQAHAMLREFRIVAEEARR